MRDKFIGLGAAAAMLACPAVAWALDLRPGIPEGAIEVSLSVLVSTPLDPASEFAFIDLVPLNDGTDRLAVSTVQGTIRVLDSSGQLLSTPMLTNAQSGLVTPQEAGMTGIAFHPEFHTPGAFGYGKLYTITTEAPSDEGGLSNAHVDFPVSNENYQDVIREWNLAEFGSVPGAAANLAFTGELADSREILRIDQPGPFHNVADLTFNTHATPGDADYGLLYITSGDGGGSGRFAAAQDLGTIYGNILRIDPNPNAHPLQRFSANTGLPAYSVPDDNPFNGDDAQETRSSDTLAEIYSYGLRSPYRLNFDRETGDLYVGDVGENQHEEVNVISAGGNYGWGRFEGNNLRDSGVALGGPSPHSPPLVELERADARSITGGFVYRGAEIPELQGKYVFADLGQGFSSSAIFYAIVDPNDPDGDPGDVFEFRLSDGSPLFEGNTQSLPERIFSIGEDAAGELYLVAGPDPRQAFNPNRPSLIIRLDASEPFLFGDLSGDLAITGVDWSLFKAGQGVDFSGMTTGQSYLLGDLDADLDHDLHDFSLFRGAYEQFNGAGSFSRLLQAPEPGATLLAALAGGWRVPGRRHRQRVRAILH